MLDLFRHTRSSSLSTPYRHTVGPNVKNPPKIRFQKIVKLTDHSYACNSLTYSEYKTYPLETEIDVILLKLALKNS